MATQAAVQAAELDPEIVSATLLRELNAQRQLSGLLAASVTRNAKTGETVRIPVLGRRTSQGPIAAATALTPADTALGSTAVTVEKFGDIEHIEAEALEDQDSFDVTDLLLRQTDGHAEKVDDLVYAALIAATPAAGATTDLAVAGTLDDLYEKMVDEVARYKRETRSRPSHWIIGPDQAAALLKRQNDGVEITQIKAENGMITSVAGVPVIEYLRANANAVTAGLVQCVLIDQRAALAEVWRRDFKTQVDDVTLFDEDVVRVGSWFRYGTAVVLDSAGTNALAVGHVSNP